MRTAGKRGKEKGKVAEASRLSDLEGQRRDASATLPDLPYGWRISTVGEVAKCITGNTPPKDRPEYYGDLIPFVKPTQLDDRIVSDAPERLSNRGAHVARVIEAESVLVSCIGNLGKTAITGRTVAFNQQINAAIFHDGVEPKYGLYFFQSSSARHQLENLSSATTIAIVNKSKFQSIKIPIAPLPEQRRIVARIEELFSRLDAGVAALRQAKAQLQRYRQSVLAAAVTGELTREWREQHHDDEPASTLLERILDKRRENWSGTGKYMEPIGPETTELPSLPMNWTWATLPQLGDLNRGKSKHRPRNAEFLYGGPYPFVQTGDVRHANGTVRRHTQTYSEEGLKQSRLWPAGTLCITIAANIAESAILGYDACFPDSVVGFIPASPELDVRYYEFFMQTAREDLERYAPATAQKNINLKILSEVAVPLPPLAEQHQIVAEVEARTTAIDHLEAELDRQITRSRRLRQSALASAFAGNLIPNA
jgi:type I restriction enzyme S subunit